MHDARFCHLPSPSRSILFESGWNCNLKFGFLGQYDQKNYFSNYMDEKYGRAKNLSRLTYLDSDSVWRGQFALKFFTQNIWQENITNYLCFFHKFLVQDHLYEHFCTLKQFCVFSGFACVALIYFFFIIKLDPSVGETLIEIASAVAKQTKKVWFSFFQNILPATIFYFRQRDISKLILNLISE